MTECLSIYLSLDNVVSGESLIELAAAAAVTMKEKEVLIVAAVVVVCFAASGN